MTDLIANFFLTFSHQEVIIPLLILGLIWVDRVIFSEAVVLVLVTMLFNSALKAFFQVPLSPAIGIEGFAFPSGHMQSSFVVYGWLGFRFTSKLLRVVLAVIITGIAFSLVYFGYHNFIDIIGAVFFGLLTIIGYNYAEKKYAKKRNWWLLVLASIFLLYIAYRYKIQAHNLMAFFALAGFVLAEKLPIKNLKLIDIKDKLLATILCFFSIGVIISIFSIFLHGLQNLQWLFIGAISQLITANRLLSR